MTFGLYLQHLLDQRQWTQEQAAEACTIPRSAINQLINNKRTLTVAMALRFERAGLGRARALLIRQLDDHLRAARDGR